MGYKVTVTTISALFSSLLIVAGTAASASAGASYHKLGNHEGVTVYITEDGDRHKICDTFNNKFNAYMSYGVRGSSKDKLVRVADGKCATVTSKSFNLPEGKYIRVYYLGAKGYEHRFDYKNDH